MRKKHNKCFLPVYCGVIICLLTGCQQAPQAVLERKAQYQENKQMNQTDVQYCDVSELTESSMDDIVSAPQNLKLPKKVDFSTVEEVDLLTLQFPKDACVSKEQLASEWDITNPEWEYFEGSLAGDTGYSYDNSEKKEYLYVGENGVVSYLGNDVYEDYEADEQDEQTECYYVSKQDISHMDCQLNRENVSLLEQIEKMETWMNQSAWMNHDYDYRVQTVWVRKREDGTQRLKIQAQLYYKGMSLDYYGGGMTEENGNPRVKQMDSVVELELSKPDIVSSCLYSGVLDVVETEKQETVIDFPSAVRLVEKELSGFQQVEISDVQVLYTLIPEYDYETGSEYYAAPGNLVKGIPVYSFMIPMDRQSTDDSENDMCYVNVNMLTGEITSNLKEKGYVVK